jgi:hypothetical protein
MLAIYEGVAAKVLAGVVNILAAADVEVRRESDGALAALFTDEAGTAGLANPALALTDAEGKFKFYVAGNVRGYSIKVTLGALTYTMHNVAIGTAEQIDISGVALEGQVPMGTPSVSPAAQWVDPIIPEVKQTVTFGAVDANGYANYLSAGAGLNFNVDANPTSLVIDYAAGVANYRATLSADAANQGALVASNTNFVHSTYVTPASVTWGNCLIAPQYGYAFDRTRAALLNFEGVNGAVATTDDFGNTWSLINGAHIDTAQKQFGASSCNFDGVNDYAECTNFTTLGDGSWEVVVWARWNVLPTAGNSQFIWAVGNASDFGSAIVLNNTAGTTKAGIFVSSDGGSWNIANASFGANTVWAIATWYRFRFVFDALAGTYKIYLSIAGALETVDVSVASAARVCAITKMRLGCQLTGSSLFNGWIDALRFLPCATKTTAEVPGGAPAIGDYPVHFFSIPEMKMYEVTGASVVAGTNPGMTRRSRVFHGEQDTNGAAVTATRNYALRGKYVSDEFSAASSAVTSKNHNIGVRPKLTRCVMVCKTAELGYVSGDEKEVLDPQFDSSDHGVEVKLTRNNVSAIVATGAISSLNVGTFTVASPTAANWKLRLEAQRGW